MTTIAVKGNIMASDSLMTSGGYREGFVEKLKQLEDGGILGFCGACAVQRKCYRLIEENLVALNLDMECLEFPTEQQLPYQILWLKFDKTLWLLDSGLGWIQIDQPHAEGSGSLIARGAMEFGATAEQAVHAAIQIDTGSGGEIRAFSLPEVRPMSKAQERFRRVWLTRYREDN